jgi:hypothetical protein
MAGTIAALGEVGTKSIDDFTATSFPQRTI